MGPGNKPFNRKQLNSEYIGIALQSPRFGIVLY